MIDRAPTGFPALRKLFRDEFPPLLRALDPFLRNLNPILTGLGLYKHEITAVLANVAAATNATLPTENANGEQIHFLRAMGPLNPESLATFASRLTTNRNSAYSQPLWAKDLASGLPSFDTRQCSSGITASLDPETPNDPAFKDRTKKGDAKEAEDFFNRLKKYAFAEQASSGSIPAPGCTQQAPFNPISASRLGRPPTSTRSNRANSTGPHLRCPSERRSAAVPSGKRKGGPQAALFPALVLRDEKVLLPRLLLALRRAGTTHRAFERRLGCDAGYLGFVFEDGALDLGVEVAVGAFGRRGSSASCPCRRTSCRN